MKLFLASLVIVVLIGILLNTIIKYTQYKRISFSKFVNFKSNNTNSLFDGNLDEKLENYIYLDSFNKWKNWIYIMSFTLLPLSLNYNYLLQLVVGIICILAVGDYLHSANRFVSNNNCIMKFMFYILNLLILFIYISQFSLAFLETDFSLELLLVITTISIFYSFLFIKNVVDVIPSYFFQFINFIVILLLFNFVVIGFNYGLYYLANNDIYEYYQSNEVQKIYENFSGSSNDPLKWEYISIVMYEGIEPFFNFPQRILGEYGIISFIPLIEHFIGNVFNLLIIGFFVSYSVTNLFERRKEQLTK